MFALTSECSADLRLRWLAWAGVVLTILDAPSAGQADESAAIARLKKLGASVVTEGRKPGKPVWFVELTRERAGKKFTEAELKLLKEFKGLRYLNVGLRITDAGVRELSEIPSLQTLLLSSDRITDAGVRELVKLTQLRELFLGTTQVTDAGLRELKVLRNLQVLALNNTRVTNAGMAELKDITSLRSLNLRETLVTDPGLRDLADLPKLEVLVLEKTKVTDAGMRELKRCKTLQSLKVFYTQVTDAGVSDLKSALPGLSVHRELRK